MHDGDALTARFAAIGIALPERVLAKDELERLVDSSDDRILARTGIRERHVVSEGESLPPDKVFVNLEHVGNTSAASIPLALAEAVIAGPLTRGDLVLAAAFGGGLTWAATLCRW